MILDKTYLNWQKKLADNPLFRGFWVFWGIYSVGFFYLGVIFFFFPVYRPMAVLAFAAFIIAKLFFCNIIYFFYKKPRPYQRLKFTVPVSKFFLSWGHNRFNSFPSSHAASLAAISLVTFVFIPQLGFLGFVSAVLNGMGRVVLGYHDEYDIVGGWILGILSAFLALYLVAVIW